jgi:ankyrin repeat protein
MLTALHKCVLGFIGRSLEEELSFSAVDIGAQDVHGRTPLWWACRKFDLVATRQLLRFGADPNIADNAGLTPFLNAVVGNHSELILLLIKSGAGTLHVSKSCENALHFAHILGLADLETLMQQILDVNGHELINAQNIDGRTPLAWAA